MIGICVVVGLIVVAAGVFIVSVIWYKMKNKGLHCIIISLSYQFYYSVILAVHNAHGGIEMRPNEAYGMTTGIETVTPNEVQRVSTDDIKTTPNEVYGLIASR